MDFIKSSRAIQLCGRESNISIEDGSRVAYDVEKGGFQVSVFIVYSAIKLILANRLVRLQRT